MSRRLGRTRLTVELLEGRETPAAGPWAVESFDSVIPGTMAPGWAVRGSEGAPGFGVTGGGVSGNGVASVGDSRRADWTWLSGALPADQTITAAVRVDSLVPAEVFVRGRNLDGPRATYYAASVVRGPEIRLLRIAGGAVTELARLNADGYLSGSWLDVSLTAQGSRLQVRVRRRDTGAWLNGVGRWQAEPAAALNAIDRVIVGRGQAGLARPAGVAGTVMFDEARVGPGDGDVTPPVVGAHIQRLLATRLIRFLAPARDAGGLARVEYLVDGEPVGGQVAPPYRLDVQPLDLANGGHVLTVRAWDRAGNLAAANRPFVLDNGPAAPRPTIPRHYSHIRVAALAYTGNPMGPVEQALLKNSIDLVVPNSRYLGAIDAASPDTPQLVYSNLSNLYLDLLTDWLDYADRHGLRREWAFDHVAQATAFAGDSPSSQPVNWFWNVSRGPLSGTAGFKTATAVARRPSTGGVPLGGAGEALYVGYPDRFREINLTIARAATQSWSGVLEYPTAVDANGRPTAWKPLPVPTDSTNGFRASGWIMFDPPAGWRPAAIPGSAARLFYVRVRTTSGSAAVAPVAASILGRDYVGANGGKSGTMPAFDAAADKDGNGYLNDREYAGRRPGFDARFLYESRLFYPYYGQMRFVTNPAGTGVGAWAADYYRRLLAANPLADGVFLDNSSGRLPATTAALVESTDAYASAYAAVLGAVNRSIAPKWVLANTSGGGTAADQVVRQVPGTIEEFALRPMGQTWAQFQDLAGTVSRRLALSDSAGLLVLDSLSVGGSPTDPRTRVAALASYYLVADPDQTLFMAWGGEEPASAWSRHWWDAIGFDIGRPRGALFEFATGADPANPALTYHVFGRQYDRALVLDKPISYAAGKGTGGTGDETATGHLLNGNYRPLNADGTLGPVTQSVTLRNGEGAILVRA